MKTLLLAFGNEYIKTDSLAIELSKELSRDIEKAKDADETKEGDETKETDAKIRVDIKRCYSVDSLYDYQDYDNIFILDVVKGMEKTMLIDDIDKIKGHKLYSLHDFDLGFFLKLMKELGVLKDIKIIGIPQQGNKEEIKKEVLNILNSIS